MLSVLRMMLCWEFTSYPKVWMTYVECTQNDTVLGVHLISQGINDLCWVYSEWCCAGSSPHIPRYERLMLNDAVLGVHLISQGMKDLCWVYSEWYCVGSSPHIPRYEWLMLSVLRIMLCWEFTSYPKVWMTYVECTQNDTVLGVHLISQGMNDLCWVYSEWCCAGSSPHIPRYEWLMLSVLRMMLCWEFTSYPKVWKTYVECTQNDTVLGVHLISQGMNDLCWVYSEWYCAGSSPHIPRYKWLMLSVLRMMLCWEFTSYPKVWMTYVEFTQNYASTVKNLFFTWHNIQEETAMDIFTRLYFRDCKFHVL